MKALTVILAASAALVTAQNFQPYIPSCANKCLLDAVASSSSCKPFEGMCICEDTTFQKIFAASAQCINSACGNYIALDLLPGFKEYCNDVAAGPSQFSAMFATATTLRPASTPPTSMDSSPSTTSATATTLSPASTPPTSIDSSPSTRSSTDGAAPQNLAGPVAGSICGAVAFAGLAAGALWYYKRRSRRHRAAQTGSSPADSGEPPPEKGQLQDTPLPSDPELHEMEASYPAGYGRGGEGELAGTAMVAEVDAREAAQPGLSPRSNGDGDLGGSVRSPALAIQEGARGSCSAARW